MNQDESSRDGNLYRFSGLRPAQLANIPAFVTKEPPPIVEGAPHARLRRRAEGSAADRIGRRTFSPGADRGVAGLLTAASWVLQRLPGHVVEEQRGAVGDLRV